MTASKHLKQLVRARMARTGESYTAARRHLVGAPDAVALNPSYTIPAHGRHGQAVTFSADGTLLASTGQDAAVRLWHATDGSAAFALEGHDQVVNDVVLLERDGLAVSASSDRTVRVWDLPTREPRAVLSGHRAPVTCLAAAADHATVVSGGYDGRLFWWDVAAGERRQEVRSPLKRIADLAVVASAGQLLEAGASGEVVVHDLKTGQEIARFDTGSAGVIGLAVSPGGDVVAAAGYDGAITLWAASSWDPLRRIDVGARASAVDISADGRLLAVAWDHHVGLWTLDADAPVATAELPIKGVYAVAFSPDGRRLAQTGADGKVRCWRLH